MKKIFRKTAVVSGMTLASRVLGVIRDALIAMFFGTSSHTDAFFIAFRPFDLVRKLFSEGILSISFIPVFSTTLETEGRSRAAQMVFSFFCFLSLAGVIVVLAGMVMAPVVIGVIAPGFVDDPVTFDLATVLFRVMLPYFWFIMITALCMGVLNSFENFGIPAVAPVIFNLVVIVFTLVIISKFDIPVVGLAVGVCLGGVLQLAIQVPYMVRLGMVKLPGFRLFHPKVKTVLKTMLPCMIGAASYQINIMVASFFASTLGEGSVSFIYYADRLVQFPLALFAVSVATVLLPGLSRDAAHLKWADISDQFSMGARLVFFITMPAMAGLIALDEQIVALLFGYGAFDRAAIQETSGCLFYLVTGLWAFTGVRLFATLYYALSRIRIPFYSGLVSIGLNFLLCYFLGEHLGLTGLVLSVSISAAAGFGLLFACIPGALNIRKKEIFLSACRSLFLSGIMFVFVEKVAKIVLVEATETFWFKAGVAGCILSGICFYWGANRLISSPELSMLKTNLFRR